MDLFFRRRHEFFLERAFSREIQGFKQVLLSALVYFSRVITDLNSLFLFERQMLLDSGGHFQTSKYSLTSFFIQCFIMVSIRRVRLLRDR